MKIIRFDGHLLKKTIDDIVRVTELQGIPWYRFTELNNLLKGFRTNELTVLSGRTGVGKTTFLCEYSLDLAEQGVNTLWGSFEMPLRKICKTMVHQFAGEPLLPSLASRITDWASTFGQSVPMYFMNFHGAQFEDEVLKVMEEGVQQFGIEHILIDNMQFMLGARGNSFEERFQRQDRFVQRLRSFTNDRNVHVTVVAHTRKEDFDRPLTLSSLYGGGKIAQEADNVMLIQTETNTAFPKKYIQLVKNRYDGTLGRLDLNFNKDRLSYRPRSRELIIPASNRRQAVS